MPNLDLNDVSIHYEETGKGSFAFVHCHGIGQSGKPFIEEFSFWEKYFDRVITWDNRGLGESSQATKYSVPLYANDLARLLNHLNITKVVLHGVSWGGIVVQQFALDYQDMCSAIIIDSSSSEVNVAAAENWYKQSEESRIGKGIRKIKPEHMDSFLAQARATAGLREHPYTPRLKEIKCPALIVGGGQDSIAGAGGSIILGRNLPNSRTEIFQDSEHGVYKHKQAEFRKLVLEFCKNIQVIN